MDTKNLDGIYEFMKKAYQGNWQYRFIGTPHMTMINSRGKRQSIIAHQWALMELWFQLRRICPELNEAVDSLKLYEMILNHDLGETVKGDISLARQMDGEGKDKHLTEHDEIKLLTRSLNPKVSKEMLFLFDQYEQKPVEEIKSIEVLTAKFLDYLEGHRFVIVFGNDLSEHSELISKIVKTRWVVYTQSLINVLKKNGFTKAAEEVKEVASHNVNDFAKAGVDLKFDGFK